jgi:hypothetical protein
MVMAIYNHHIIIVQATGQQVFSNTGTQQTFEWRFQVEESFNYSTDADVSSKQNHISRSIHFSVRNWIILTGLKCFAQTKNNLSWAQCYKTFLRLYRSIR